jgi:hypothetical protein
MSKAWQIGGAVLVLAGVGLVGWALRRPAPPAPPAVTPPALPPIPSTPLGQAVESRREALQTCLGHWRRSSADAPASATLRIEAVPQPAEAGPPFLLEVTVVGEATGRLVLEACAAAALQDLGDLATGPEVWEQTI